MVEHVDQLPPLPEGNEWRRAEDIKVGDVLPGGLEAGVNTEVVAVSVKPRQVWIVGAPIDDDRLREVCDELGVPVGLALMQRQNIRPARDTMLAVRTWRD